MNRILTGIYKNDSGWYHQTSMLGKTKRGGPYKCPVFAMNGRLALRRQAKAELQTEYTYRCLDCGPDSSLITKTFGKNRRRVKRCDYHNKKRKEELTKLSRQRRIDMYGRRPPEVRKLILVKNEVFDRVCLSCDREFKAIGKFNRICSYCEEKNVEVRVAHKMVF